MKKILFVVVMFLLIPSICGFINPDAKFSEEELNQSKIGNIIFIIIISVAVIAMLSIPLFNKLKKSFGFVIF